jgi:hypothetical protein
MERKWPSLKEQLRAAKAPAGSALEQLIKDNQDVHLLHTSEVQDDWDYPLWLRVYYRKNNPGVQISALSPGAAYPESLGDLGEWMTAHPDLPWGKSSGPQEPAAHQRK